MWRFLANDTARQYLVAAGKTWRKHNGGIGLITQSAADLQNAGVLDLVNEICPTKILLANPGADLAAYQRMFRLNEREGELFASLIPKRQFLVKTKEDYVCCPETIVAFAKGLNKAELHVLIELASRADAISRDGATASIRQLAV